jgi:glutamine amidotransferase
VTETVAEIVALTGPICEDSKGPPSLTYLTFVLTNGHAMLAHQGGKELFFSTHKRRCPERDTCPHFAPECETAADHGFISHLLLSSEPLQGDNLWVEMRPHEMIGADARMQVQRFLP